MQYTSLYHAAVNSQFSENYLSAIRHLDVIFSMHWLSYTTESLNLILKNLVEYDSSIIPGDIVALCRLLLDSEHVRPEATLAAVSHSLVNGQSVSCAKMTK